MSLQALTLMKPAVLHIKPIITQDSIIYGGQDEAYRDGGRLERRGCLSFNELRG